MSNLYQLTNNYEQVLNMLCQEDVDEQMIQDTLESIEGEIEDKADNYAKIIIELESKMNARKAEAKRLNESAKVLENRIKSLKNNLFNSMKAINKPKFSTDLFNFSIVRNGGKQPLAITDIVPEEFKKTILEDDIDKIRDFLEAGNKLPFAHLEERSESLRIK